MDLAGWPNLGNGPPLEGNVWDLLGPDGAEARQHHTPRFVTTDMITLRHTAEAFISVVQLPAMMIREQLSNGSLVRLLPDCAPRREIIHIAFPTRRGLIPSVRELTDYLAGRFAAVNQD